MLMVGASSPLAGLSNVPVSIAAEQPFLFPKAGYTRQIMDKLFRPYQSRLRIAMELPSVAMIKTFVALGMGVSLISESFARKEQCRGEVCLIPLADVDLWRELGLVYDQERTLPRAAAAFIELVQNGIRQSDCESADEGGISELALLKDSSYAFS
jgi:DNA-binding transcriptional LysR family regulator